MLIVVFLLLKKCKFLYMYENRRQKFLGMQNTDTMIYYYCYCYLLLLLLLLLYKYILCNDHLWCILSLLI